MSTKIAGIVLCGGRSRRMGSLKWQLPFGGQTVLQRVLESVSAVASPVIVVGSNELPVPELPAGCSFVADETAFPGPLHALLRGLAQMPDEVEAVYLTGCDAPLLTPAFISAVCNSLREGFEIAAVSDGTHAQPLAAVYRTSVLSTAHELTDKGERSLQALLKACRTQLIHEDEFRSADPRLLSLRNMNTEDEYRDLLREIVEC
ncbi:molybdenum cofactor guanylyltransferase [Planctomicrobium piriforme]|uniref:molybdenum cofactor guanylyltransferase n=1 Tax=Planctomicrobium piriforme TaxID=1576369 RepID=UPI00111378F5|nr:molybdenum cofactor guanylyltransferase [Planctomicrobium piriforme]